MFVTIRPQDFAVLCIPKVCFDWKCKSDPARTEQSRVIAEARHLTTEANGGFGAGCRLARDLSTTE